MAAQTIHALATVPGKSGVAVIRLSGPHSWAVVEALAPPVPLPRMASVRTLRDAEGGVLDEALVLCFAEGHSFTGEQSAELQLHGSIAVVRAVLAAILATGLSRMAEAGEFTRRALANERLDLSQVNGLADIIEAETELQRTAAMRVMRGELSDRVLGWRRHLLEATALVEATIDFADEDIPADLVPGVKAKLGTLLGSLNKELAGFSGRRRLRSGFQVAIVGEPNVGKSSLLNAIAESDVALVSDMAGTTRDVIELPININGLPVTLLDTAGLRETDDKIEGMGVARARARALAADMRVFLHDGPVAPSWNVDVSPGDVILRSKSDLHGSAGISAMTGEGVGELLSGIRERLWSDTSEETLVSRLRDADLIRQAVEAVERTLKREEWSEELVADDLRHATSALEGIVGGVEVEEVLGEIFASFCIGK